MVACKNNGIKSVQALLAHEATNINLQSHEGFSALMISSIIGNVRTTAMLLEHGADVTQTTQVCVWVPCKHGTTVIVDG
jgi:ankyrin repeat protein